MALSPRLRHRVFFEEQQSTRDSEGRETLEWIEAIDANGIILSGIPAAVLTGPGRESVLAGQQQSDIVARITCRWFPGLKASWRIVMEDEFGDCEYFAIASWDTDRTGRREYRIRCRSGINEGQ